MAEEVVVEVADVAAALEEGAEAAEPETQTNTAHLWEEAEDVF